MRYLQPGKKCQLKHEFTNYDHLLTLNVALPGVDSLDRVEEVDDKRRLTETSFNMAAENGLVCLKASMVARKSFNSES